jgi:hypothetical protein
MKHACDGYASANFGYEGYEGGKLLALDEGDHLLWLCHLTLREHGPDARSTTTLWRRSTRTPSRRGRRQRRGRSLWRTGPFAPIRGIERYPASGALAVAREVVQFYNRGKLLKFWKEVTQLLERKSVAELNA